MTLMSFPYARAYELPQFKFTLTMPEDEAGSSFGPAALHSDLVNITGRSIMSAQIEDNRKVLPKTSWEFFVKKMKSPEASGVKAKIAALLHKITNDHVVDSQASRMISSFLEGPVLDKSNSLWNGATDEEMRQAREGLQKFILNKLYKQLFESTSSARLRDSALSEHIQRLWWLEPKHLDIPAKYCSHSKFKSACEELEKLCLFKPPQDKLICVLNCCQIISNILTSTVNDESSGEVPSADDFLPLLIFVILQSKMSNPFLNLQYISAFCHPDDLLGSSGYMFTHFFSAITFIENINSSTLVNCSEHEFERMCYGCSPSEGELPLTFLDSSVADLRIADIPALLTEYKAMANKLQASGRFHRKGRPSVLKPVLNFIKGSRENKA